MNQPIRSLARLSGYRPGCGSGSWLKRALVGGVGFALCLHGRSGAAAVLDESFGDVPLASVSEQQGAPQLFAVAVQPDGKVIVGGAFDQVAGQPRMEIARLEADGTLDPSFTSPFEMTSVGANVLALALDGGGGIFVGGSFVVGGSLKTLIKLKADGSVDSAFVEEPVLRLRQVAKILVAGDKLYVATVGAGLDRLNSNGSYDATFTHFSDPRSQSNMDFVVQPSGQIVVGLDEAVVGINSDGTLNGSFMPVPAAYPKLGSSNAGAVLFFANFAEVGAPSIDRRFARVGTNGGIDSSFAVDPRVRIFLGVLPNDKLLIEQQLPSGEALVRLAPNGTPDGFEVPIDDVVRAIAPYPGNRLMIAGVFGQVEHKPRTRIARLLGTSVDGSGGSASPGGDSGAAGTDADSGAAGEGGTASDSSTAGASGKPSNPQAGAAGQIDTSAGAGGSASSGGVPGSGGGTPAGGSSGGCAFTRPVGPSSPLAAWLAIGALTLLGARRKR